MTSIETLERKADNIINNLTNNEDNPKIITYEYPYSKYSDPLKPAPIYIFDLNKDSEETLKINMSTLFEIYNDNNYHIDDRNYTLNIYKILEKELLNRWGFDKDKIIQSLSENISDKYMLNVINKIHWNYENDNFTYDVIFNLKDKKGHITELSIWLNEKKIFSEDDLDYYTYERSDITNPKEIQKTLLDLSIKYILKIYNIDITKFSSEGGFYPSLLDELTYNIKNIKLYRRMSIDEYQKWEMDGFIPKGKYFASKREFAVGIDDPEFEKTHYINIFTFKIPSNKLVQSGTYDYQLSEDFKL